MRLRAWVNLSTFQTILNRFSEKDTAPFHLGMHGPFLPDDTVVPPRIAMKLGDYRSTAGQRFDQNVGQDGVEAGLLHLPVMIDLEDLDRLVAVTEDHKGVPHLNELKSDRDFSSNSVFLIRDGLTIGEVMPLIGRVTVLCNHGSTSVSVANKWTAPAGEKVAEALPRQDVDLLDFAEKLTAYTSKDPEYAGEARGEAQQRLKDRRWNQRKMFEGIPGLM